MTLHWHLSPPSTWTTEKKGTSEETVWRKVLRAALLETAQVSLVGLLSCMQISIDSFQHVEAIMKEDDVSTLGLDSQDWEMVSEMVADTENS